MSVFHFGVHRFRLTDDTKGGNAHRRQHIISVDHPHPINDRIRVERDPNNPDQFRISATLDNVRLQNFKYSVSVWCGDSRVCEIHNEEATALPGRPATPTTGARPTWFPVCIVDLRESLTRMQDLGRDAYLRVHLNVSLDDAAQRELEARWDYQRSLLSSLDDGPHEPWARRHRQEPRVIQGERRANTTTDVAIFCLLCVTFVGKMARAFCASDQ